jgi:hypothetical protein
MIKNGFYHIKDKYVPKEEEYVELPIYGQNDVKKDYDSLYKDKEFVHARYPMTEDAIIINRLDSLYGDKDEIINELEEFLNSIIKDLNDFISLNNFETVYFRHFEVDVFTDFMTDSIIFRPAYRVSFIKCKNQELREI